MHIRHLRLENIKAFDRLSLDFIRPKPNRDPYAGLNFFVGGNSAGKSTILKAIAMGVSGPTVAGQQLITPAGWIRRGEKKAQIEISMGWDPSIEQFRDKGGNPGDDGFNAGLIFESEEQGSTPTLKGKDYRTPNRTKIRSAERGPWHPDAPGWYLGAYGPLRRLTGSSTEAMRFALARGKMSSCVTLFREDAALSESETWLKQAHARALEQNVIQLRTPSTLVKDVQEFLNAGLMPEGFVISKVTVDHVYMSTPNGGELPLRDLSDGCRSAYALMLDIVHNMAVIYGEKGLFVKNANDELVVSRPGVILMGTPKNPFARWRCAQRRKRFGFEAWFGVAEQS